MNQRILILGFTTLENRRARPDLSEVFKILKRYKRINGDCFFRIKVAKTRGHSMKLYKKLYIGLC